MSLVDVIARFDQSFSSCPPDPSLPNQHFQHCFERKRKTLDERVFEISSRSNSFKYLSITKSALVTRPLFAFDSRADLDLTISLIMEKHLEYLQHVLVGLFRHCRS